MKHYFENFLEDRKTYVLAENFWIGTIGEMLLENKVPIKKWLATTNNKGERFFDGDPIFSVINNKNKRALRIIQLAPKSDKPFIKAWVEKRLNQDDQEIDVLAISLELVEETKQIVVKLAENWFVEKISTTQFDSAYIKNLMSHELSLSDLKKLKKVKTFYFSWFENQADSPSGDLTNQFTSRIINYFKKDVNAVFSTEQLNQTYLNIKREFLSKTLTDVYGIKGGIRYKSKDEIVNIIISHKTTKSAISIFLKNYKDKIHSSNSKVGSLIKSLEEEIE